MMNQVEIANHYARMSCTRWNKSTWQPKTKLGQLIKSGVVDKAYRLSRKRYRKKYREIARAGWETPQQQFIMEFAKLGGCIDTYPPLYSDPNFANWDESDAPDDYSLISDQSGCVIKYSTSYCAWKIFELTGKWPQKKTKARIDAKNWQYFLKQAGYTKVVENFYTDFAPEHRYVGINPNDGKWGIVVWFERIDRQVEVSTYRDRMYSYECIPREKINDYIWIEIN